MGYSWIVLGVEIEGRAISNLFYHSGASCKKKIQNWRKKGHAGMNCCHCLLAMLMEHEAEIFQAGRKGN